MTRPAARSAEADMSARPAQRSTRRIAPLLAVLLALSAASAALLTGSAASAASEPVTVRSIDASNGLLVADLAGLDAKEMADVSAKVDGKSLPAPTVTPLSDLGNDVMAVLDTSGELSNGAVQIGRTAIVDSLAPSEGGITETGVVTIGGGAVRRVGLVESEAQLDDALGVLQPSGATALWDGIVAAAQSFRGNGAHTVVAIVGTADAGSAATSGAALRALESAGAQLRVVALSGGTAELEALSEIVGQVGGSVAVTPSDDVGAAVKRVAGTMDGLARVATDAPKGTAGVASTVTFTTGSRTVTAAFLPGTRTTGDALAAGAGDAGFYDRLFSSSFVKYLIVLLGCLAAGMVVYSIASLMGRGSDQLDKALRHYDGFTVDAPSEFDDQEASLAKGAMMRRAVEITGDFAQRQGLLQRVEVMLERADLPLRPAEAIFFYASIVVLAMIGAAVMFGSLLFVLIIALIAAVTPRFVLKFRIKRREKQFIRQLPDMLQLLAGTLRAGYSISQGFDAVSKEVHGPMGKELRRIMAEARLGRPLEEALDSSAERVRSEDFGWAVMAIRIQREVGGNLAELLMTVSETMVQRERLRRDISALTAEGRMSAIILGLLPPGLGLVMVVMNPAYIHRLIEDLTGMILLGVGGVAMLVGFLWMQKLITIEI